MKPKHPLTQFAAKHQSLLLVLIGLAVLIGAFVAATKSNMANIQSTLSNTCLLYTSPSPRDCS